MNNTDPKNTKLKEEKLKVDWAEFEYIKKSIIRYF